MDPARGGRGHAEAAGAPGSPYRGVLRQRPHGPGRGRRCTGDGARHPAPPGSRRVRRHRGGGSREPAPHHGVQSRVRDRPAGGPPAEGADGRQGPRAPPAGHPPPPPYPPGHGVTDDTRASVDPLSRIHLDTDLGSDTDDLCALAMLLGWEGAELVGVTTNTDPGGLRAGFVRYALDLGGRAGVPVEAGAEGTLSEPMAPFTIPGYWPERIAPRPARPGAALELLAANAQAGATIAAIGPYTNLAMLEAIKPGGLKSTGLVVMGGHVTAPREGLPPWGVHEDFNVQQDRGA